MQNFSKLFGFGSGWARPGFWVDYVGYTALSVVVF